MSRYGQPVPDVCLRLVSVLGKRNAHRFGSYSAQAYSEALVTARKVNDTIVATRTAATMAGRDFSLVIAPALFLFDRNQRLLRSFFCQIAKISDA